MYFLDRHMPWERHIVRRTDNCLAIDVLIMDNQIMWATRLKSEP